MVEPELLDKKGRWELTFWVEQDEPGDAPGGGRGRKGRGGLDSYGTASSTGGGVSQRKIRFSSFEFPCRKSRLYYRKYVELSSKIIALPPV
jgi:hypothetical protein